MDKILLEVDIDDSSVSKAITDIQKATDSINQLKAANKALADQGKVNSEQYVKNNEDIKTLNKTVADNSRVVQANNQLQKAQKDSIDQLRAANTLLLKEKNSLSTSDEASKKRIDEINKLYDANIAKINANSSATEKQRANIGNYSSALDKLVPGLGGVVQGTEAATKASLAFIATPIGAVIGALGLAISSVVAYFKSSEDAENELAEVTSVLGAVFEQLMNFVEALGGFLVHAFKDPKQALLDFADLLKTYIINRFTGMLELIPQLGKAVKLLFEGEFSEAATVATNAVGKVALGVENVVGKTQDWLKQVQTAVDEGIKAGQQLAAMQREIDVRERELTIARAKTDLEVSKLREQSIQQEGQAKKDTIMAAIALEKQLAAQEMALSVIRRDQAALELKNNGDTKEAKEKLAKANADIINQEAAQYQATLKFQKELEKLNDQIYQDYIKKIQQIEKDRQDAVKSELETAAELKAIDDALEQHFIETDEDRKKHAQDLQDWQINLITETAQKEINIQKEKLLKGEISQGQYNEEIANLNLAALESQAAINKQFGEEDVTLTGQITDAKIAIGQKEVAAKQAQGQIIAQTLSSVASVFGKQTTAYKVLASASALIASFETAQKAASSVANIPYVGPGLAAAAFAAALASGLANVAAINNVQLNTFEDGGVIPIQGKSHAQGGEDVAIGGRRVANVQSGEHMVVLKRGAYDIYNQLSRANELAGGVAFAHDRTPRRYLADGGLVARTASPSVQSFDQMAIQMATQLKDLKIYTRTTELEKVQKNAAQVKVLSELR